MAKLTDLTDYIETHFDNITASPEEYKHFTSSHYLGGNITVVPFTFESWAATKEECESKLVKAMLAAIKPRLDSHKGKTTFIWRSTPSIKKDSGLYRGVAKCNGYFDYLGGLSVLFKHQAP